MNKVSNKAAFRPLKILQDFAFDQAPRKYDFSFKCKNANNFDSGRRFQNFWSKNMFCNKKCIYRCFVRKIAKFGIFLTTLKM